jgi:hypothetical protein
MPETFRCSACHLALPAEAFTWSTARRQDMCRTCRRSYNRRYAVLNADRRREYYRQRRALRRDKGRALVAAAKASGCVDCGEADATVLDFDHVREPKRANVADLVAFGSPPSTVAKEIAKCEVVCANCHAIRTGERKPNYRTRQGIDSSPTAGPYPSG